MTPSYSHLLIPSLALFVEHDLLSRRNAFYTQTGRFYSYVDPKTQLNAWGAPWPGFVYDSSIGMPVSGVYFDGSFVGRPTIHIDFNGGRILTSGTPTSVTGTFLRREFNIYTNAISEQLLLERAQSAIRQRYEHSQNYIAPNSIVAPFINLSKSNGSNYPFAYGGEDQTKTIVRATILTDNVYRAEGLADYFMDLARRCI